MKNTLKKFIPFTKTTLVLAVFIIFGQFLYNFLNVQFNLPGTVDVRKSIFIIFSIIYCIYVVLYSFVACKYIDKRKLDDFGFGIRKKDIFFTVISLVLTFLGFFMFAIITKKFGITKWEWTGISFIHVLSAVVVYITVGINEEIFFRGYLFKSLSYYGKIPAYIISILIFTLIHFTQQGFSIPYLIELLLSSFLLIYIFDVTGSIWPGIVIHGGYDLFINLFGGNINKASLITWKYLDKRFYLNDLFMYISIIVDIIIILILYFMYRSKQSQTSN